jgi:hypothetical protein
MIKSCTMIAALLLRAGTAKNRLQHSVGTCAFLLSAWACAQSGIPDPFSELQGHKTAIGWSIAVHDALPINKDVQVDGALHTNNTFKPGQGSAYRLSSVHMTIFDPEKANAT